MGALASLLASLASGEAFAAVQRARTAAIVYGVAAVLAACGVGFLIAAGYIWASQRYGAIEAALGFGGGFILLALIVLVIFKLSAGSRSRKRIDRRKADLAALGVTAGLAALPALVRGKGGLGVVLGPAIALVAYAIYRENTRPSGEPDPDDPA